MRVGNRKWINQRDKRVLALLQMWLLQSWPLVQKKFLFFFKTTALRACRNSISPVKRHFKFHQVVWREETRASRFTLGVAICWNYGWRRGVVVPREKGEARKPLERSIRRDALRVETGTMEKRNGWTEFRVCSGTLVWAAYRSWRPNDWEVTAVINVLVY